MKLTELAIKNKVVTLTIVFLAVVGGLLSFKSMPKAEDPGFTIRNAVIVTYFPGASPKRVEELVTDKIEEAVMEIPELKEVKSTSKNINNDVWVGEELEMLFDLSVRYVEMLLEGAEPDLESPYIEMIVKELLKDEDHPNASITELLELAKEKRSKEMVLKKAFTE